MKATKSKYALLGLLAIEPMSGYDIRQTIERTIGHFWKEGYGQIYPMLKQLAAEGLATISIEQHAGRPDRHIYQLTDAGWQALRGWLVEPVAEFAPTRNELLLKLFFGRHVPAHVGIAHVEQFRQLQAALLGNFVAIEEFLCSQHAADPDQPYWLITVRHGQYLSRAVLAWCDETLATLAAMHQEQTE